MTGGECGLWSDLRRGVHSARARQGGVVKRRLRWNICTTISALAVVTAMTQVAGAAGGTTTETLVGPPSTSSPNPGFLEQVACASAGNCAGIGEYPSGAGPNGAFVVSEVNGQWGPEQVVTGQPLQQVGDQLNAVQCMSAGNCLAVGTETDGAFPIAIVVAQRNGVWLPAERLPSIAALPEFTATTADELRCWRTTCELFGSYTGPAGIRNLYVAGYAGGSFSEAQPMPLAWAAALGSPSGVDESQLTCPSAEHCVVGGELNTMAGNDGIFVASVAEGAWVDGQIIGGSTSNFGAQGVTLDALACSSLLVCVIGGSEGSLASNASQAWAATSVDGDFGPIEVPPGLAAIEDSAGGGGAEASADVTAASCAGAVCVAGGSFQDGNGDDVPFTVRAAATGMRPAEVAPGMLTFMQDVSGQPGSIYGGLDGLSCASTGTCTAVGEVDWSDPTTGSIDSAGLFEMTVGAAATGAPTSLAFSEPQGGADGFSLLSTSTSATSSALLLSNGATYEEVALTPTGPGTPSSFDVSGSFSPGGDSEGDAISCWAQGDCVAVGLVEDGTDEFGNPAYAIYAAQEQSGTWQPEEVIGSADSIDVDQLTCPSADLCVLVGQGQFASDGLSAFVLRESDGQWGSIEPITGLSTYTGSQPNGAISQIDDVDCPSSTWCAVSGTYLNASDTQVPFVSTGAPSRLDVGVPLVLPGTKPANFQPSAMSCSAIGACRIAGSVLDRTGDWPAVTTETHRGWSRPVTIPGVAGAIASAPAGLAYPDADVAFLDCPPQGACEAIVLVIYAEAYIGEPRAFVYTSALRGGTWTDVRAMPGFLAATAPFLDGGWDLLGLACSSPGNCVMAGTGTVEFGIQTPTDLAFASVESHGTWTRTSIIAADPGAHGAMFYEAATVGCEPDGPCDLFGSYELVYSQQLGGGVEEWSWAPIEDAAIQWDGDAWSSPVDLATGDVMPGSVACSVGQCTLLSTSFALLGGEQAVVSTIDG